MEINKIIQGDALTELKKLPNESINCVMTSPPYWALRDYGTEGNIWDGDTDCEHDFNIVERQLHSGTIDLTKTVHSALINGGLLTDWKTKDGFCSKCGAWKGNLGLEPNFDLYIKHLCDIFDEVKRVLRKDGTCWVNLGDTYYTKSGTSFIDDNLTHNKHLDMNKGLFGEVNNTNKEMVENGTGINKANELRGNGLLQDKNLSLIPFRFAIEMQNRGWILRNVIIWHKPNCMPSSVKDRFTVDFEYLFFFVKSKKYWFETQYEKLAESSLKDPRLDKGREEHIGKSATNNYGCNATTINSFGRNKRTVWSICPKPFKESHFATYPEELCETPIKAGCPEFVCNKCGKPREKILYIEKNNPDFNQVKGSDTEFISRGGVRQTDNGTTPHFKSPTIKELGYTDCKCNAGFSGGIVLDPFFGAGTTGLVALKQNKKFIGIELNPEYIKIAEARIKPYLEQQKLWQTHSNTLT